MNDFDHFTIRGYVAEHRKRDARLHYPFPLPPDLTPEQINSLLPPISSPKLKQQNCKSCFGKFIKVNCPHQLLIEAEASVVPSDADELVTIKDNSSEDKSNRDTSVAIPATDIALQILNCTVVRNDAGVESTAKHQQKSEDTKTAAIIDHTKYSGLLDSEKQKALFDLNETPTPENSDAASDNNDTATKEHNVDSSELQITHKLASVDKKNAENTEDRAASQSPVNGAVNCNGFASTKMEEDELLGDPGDDLSLCGEKYAIVKRRVPKYRTLYELLNETKRIENERVPIPEPRSKKTESKKKKKRNEISEGTEISKGTKKTESGNQEKINIKISKARKDAPGANTKSRRSDFNLPLEDNYRLAGVTVTLQSRPASSSKGQEQVSLDKNDNFDAVLPESSKKVPSASQNDTVNFLLPKKRRIFGNEVLNTLSEADQSHEVKSEDIQKRHKRIKHDRSSSKEKQSLDPVVERSAPAQNKNAPSKVARREKKDMSEVSRIVSENKSLDKSSSAGKELVLRDTPISTSAVDVTLAAPQNETEKKLSPRKRKNLGNEPLKKDFDTEKLCQLKSDAAKRKKHNRRVTFKIDEHDSPSSEKKRKKHGRATGGSALRKRGRAEKSDTDGKELVLREAPVPSSLPSSEQPLSGIHLLCMVASESEELGFLSDAKPSDTLHPLQAVRDDEIHVHFIAPPKSDVLGMGYNRCVEVTVPAEHVSIDDEGDSFMLGPEDLPLRGHRIRKPAEQRQRMCTS